MDRKTGVVEGISETKDSDIRGSIVLEVVLKETIKMKAKLEEIGNNQLVRRQIKQHLVKVDPRYETVLLNAQIEQLVVAMHQLHKRCNAIQNEVGSENTAFMRQEIKFSKVLINHIALVRDEPIHLGIEFDSTLKIRKLMEKLRNHHKSEKTNRFANLHGYPPRDIDLYLLHFKSEHTPFVEWGDAYCAS